MTKRLIAACGLLLPFALVALASDHDKRTVVTLNEPVLVAGVQTVTLQPGKYVLRLLNHESNRNVVEIFNEREDHLFTFVLAIPNFRLVPTGDTELRFWETPTGNPIALRAWFYPGDQWGQEFVYPKGLAANIAHQTGEPVLAAPQVETEAELEEAPVTRIDQAGEETAIAGDEFVLDENSREELEGQPEATVGSAAAAKEPASEEQSAPEPLPATASPYFLLAAAGMVSAVTGLGLKRARGRAR
jgi:hypothetical protein